MSSDVHPGRIVLLADGTGNAFSTQASNIWRLYGALDLSDPDQVVHYIRGVGTSGFRPLAIVDGATGLGVPANVRELYRFLCRTWRPGVEVYLFGFSRGAFTIRTLIGLVASQGLVPVTIDGEPVDRAELRRMSMAAWRAYRAETAPAGHVWFTVTATRAIRDAILRAWGWARHQRPYAVVRRMRDDQNRRFVELQFAGLFDTVEAYGVPLEALRTAISRTIWPISFRNRKLSPIVRRARHALSLDDERVSFHPVRFDQSLEAQGEDPRIREVWFAGVHSDVGGGYPDDALAHVPLRWMIDEATACGGDTPLRWRPGTTTGIASAAAPLAAAHDSRAGLASLYRYGPRPIREGAAEGGTPIIHHAVAEKMVFGPDDYAPLTLPGGARVLMPDGALRPIRGFGLLRHAGPNATVAAEDVADRAVARLSRPNAGFVELARDRIWLRELSAGALAVAALVAAALPVVAPWLDRRFTAALASLGSVVGLPGVAAFFQRRIDDARGGLGANLTDLQATFGGVVPGYAKGWVQAVVDQPLASMVVIGLAVTLYRVNGLLRDRIADAARRAWFIDAGGGATARVPDTLATRLARRLRGSTRLSAARGVLGRTVAPAAMLAVAIATGLVLLDRAAVSYASGAGAFCPDGLSADLLRQPRPGQSNRAEGFTPDQPCWPTGLWLEKGRTYRLWMEATSPLLDGTAVVPLEGYTGGGWFRWASLPFRRWWGAAWMQPVARIGATGTIEWPLVSSEGVLPQTLPEAARLPAGGSGGPCSPATPEAEVVAAAAHAGAVRQGFATQFVAPATGELFVFSNDALPLPFGALSRCFYRDNAGAATITVELLPTPHPPAPDTYDFSADR